MPVINPAAGAPFAGTSSAPRRMGRCVLVWALALGFAGALAAQTAGGTPARRDSAGVRTGASLRPRPVAQAVRTSRPPRLDGTLDDPVWQAAPLLGELIQHEPVDDAPASERTEIRVLFDDEAMYIGARMHDREAASIVRGEVRRDADLTNQDALLLLLDTYRDRQTAFVFGTTPSGIEYDGQVTKEDESAFGGLGVARQQATVAGGLNLNWDGTWDVVSAVDSGGWTAVFRIPFATLRYGGGRPQIWGLNVARYIRRRNEQAFWAPIPRQYTIYRLTEAGALEGVEPPARRTAQVTPFVRGGLTRDYRVAPASTDADGEAGADAKLGLTPSLTLDLTYNTDFAQVEVDEQQINLTRFNLVFPEKRPFFLENAGFFGFGVPQQAELFFSRRIGIAGDGREVPILGGGRLSGKAGRFQLGLLNLQTREVDSAGGLLPIASTNYGAARIQRELPNRSRIGAIFVSRLNTDSTADYNLTYGLDARVGLGRVFTLDAWGARTETPGLGGGSNAYNVAAAYVDRRWEVGAATRRFGAAFNPEVGFLDRPATQYYTIRVLTHVRTPGLAWFRELRPHVTYRQHDDLAGFTEYRIIHTDSHFEFANGAFFQLPALNWIRYGLQVPFEIVPGVIIPAGTYDNFEWGFEAHTNLSAPLSIGGAIDIGGFYSGHRKSIAPTVTARLGTSLIATARLSLEDVELDEGSFTTTLIGLKTAYSFTPRIYLQSLIQYNDQTRSLSGNVRFGWLGPAGTGLFVVYNEGRQTGPGSGPLDRALIVKFTRQVEVF
ncbi:MAG TPA: DUF5916 domain-containing protein [Gemmatimonadales bacterium]|nr:DUF5916 domain-containing protein [Gemmatimonadales bacterium]